VKIEIFGYGPSDRRASTERMRALREREPNRSTSPSDSPSGKSPRIARSRYTRIRSV